MKGPLKALITTIAMLGPAVAFAQPVGLTPIVNDIAGANDLGGLVALGSTLFVAAGAQVHARLQSTGALDATYGDGDGIIGDGDTGDPTFTDPEYLSTDGTRIFVTDTGAELVYIVNPVTGNLDTSLAHGDGIIGDDTADPVNPEPSLQNAHDTAYLNGILYIADSGAAGPTGQGVHLYQLSGAGGTDVLHTNFVGGPFYLAFGPLGSATTCGSVLTAPFPGSLALYVVDINDNRIYCVDNSSPNVIVGTLLDLASGSMRDLVFGPPAAGTSCSAAAMDEFANGTIAYMAEANGTNELRCIGDDSATVLSNDDDSALIGIDLVGATLYFSGAGAGNDNLLRTTNALPVELQSFEVD
jgi:hypothetical protein